VRFALGQGSGCLEEDYSVGIEPVEPWVDVLRHTILGLVRRDGPDLTARQLCAFLTCYIEDEAQTIRGLASRLSVRKTAISRALDRLSEFDLVRRRHDPMDRRSVLIQRTEAGTEFLRTLNEILADAADKADRAPIRGGASARPPDSITEGNAP
jgi:DNA-binding MarR family transcriptional regulator